MTTERLFEMITDVNGKPIPRWQERLEQLYTDSAPFGEILSLVRALIDDRAIEAILNMSDEKILSSFSGDIEAYAAEMRQKFNTIATLVRERDALKVALEKAERRHGMGCACIRCKTDDWWNS